MTNKNLVTTQRTKALLSKAKRLVSISKIF